MVLPVLVQARLELLQAEMAYCQAVIRYCDFLSAKEEDMAEAKMWAGRAHLATMQLLKAEEELNKLKEAIRVNPEGVHGQPTQQDG